MWFRNLRAYRLTQPFSLSAEQLEEQLAGKTFRACAPSQPLSLGWSSPLGVEDGPLVHAAGGRLLLRLRREERLLPATVVREALAERALHEVPQGVVTGCRRRWQRWLRGPRRTARVRDRARPRGGRHARRHSPRTWNRRARVRAATVGCPASRRRGPSPHWQRARGSGRHPGSPTADGRPRTESAAAHWDESTNEGRAWWHVLRPRGPATRQQQTPS